MTYGYARCSTNETKQDITRQQRELKEMGAEHIYTEYASGTKSDREELAKLLAAVREGDTICVLEVSRLTRSTKQLCDIIDQCKEKHLRLVIKNSITVDCRNGEIDAMTAAFLQIAGVFAELERNMISDRVKSGLENAKAKGKNLGRHKTDVNDIPNSFKRYYKEYKNGQRNVSELARLANVTRPTAYKYIEILTAAAATEE